MENDMYVMFSAPNMNKQQHSSALPHPFLRNEMSQNIEVPFVPVPKSHVPSSPRGKHSVTPVCGFCDFMHLLHTSVAPDTYLGCFVQFFQIDSHRI